MLRRHFLRSAAASATCLATGQNLLAGQTKARPGNPARLREIAAMPSLAEAYRDAFPVGVALPMPVPDRYTPEELALAARQFNVITPGNCMKWKVLQTGLDDWHFEEADSFMEWIKQEQLQTLGHCLVWNRPEYIPHWLFEGKSGPVGKRQVLDRMRASIGKIVSRYRGRLDSWEVVNEAIGDSSDGPFLRQTRWTEVTGRDFIETAYRAVQEADPAARLVYNDYNTEYSWRRKRIIQLVKELRDKDIPIDIIGIQGHYEIDDIPFDKVEQSIVELHEATGAKIAVTELDFDVVPRKQWWGANAAEREEIAKRNPYADDCPPEILERQAEQYARLFRIFLKHQEKIERVTFWGLTDHRSWLNAWPWRRTNHPLLFDAKARPKPAFNRLLQLVQPSTEPVRAHPNLKGVTNPPLIPK